MNETTALNAMMVVGLLVFFYATGFIIRNKNNKISVQIAAATAAAGLYMFTANPQLRPSSWSQAEWLATGAGLFGLVSFAAMFA